MFESRLVDARALKREAAALRNLGELEPALTTIKQAIQQLDTMRGEPQIPDVLARVVRGELADAFGIKGGILRRMNELKGASDAYEEGRKIEDQDEESTYNLLNVITLAIIQGRSPTDPGIRADIQKAVRRLTNTQSARKDEWWAWADLAESWLLLNEPSMARAAYSSGRRTGVAAQQVKRHVEILRELSDKSAKTAPEISQTIRAAIIELEGWTA